jgi:two-component system invasion response regulator UvrY
MNEKLNIRIAMADDHKIVLQGFAGLLENFGFEVIILAVNGKDLIEQIKKSKTVPDVCVLDVFMPIMNGLETIVELKRRWPEMPVLVLSGMDKPQYIKRMLLEGANGYLAKTCDAQQLMEGIIAVHKNGVYFSELVTKQYWKAIQVGDVKSYHLTGMELEVLKYCCTDLTYEEIAKEIGATTTSITGHRDSIFKKLEIHNRAMLVRFAIENGIEMVEIPNCSGEQFYRKKGKLVNRVIS